MYLGCSKGEKGAVKLQGHGNRGRVGLSGDGISSWSFRSDFTNEMGMGHEIERGRSERNTDAKRKGGSFRCLHIFPRSPFSKFP